MSKGGSGEVDKKYNRRMATIAEAQQAHAEEYMQQWRDVYQPYEETQVAANMELMPFEMEHAQAGLTAETGLIPQRAGLEGARIESEMSLMPQKTAVSSKFYEEALSGIDTKGRMDTASADMMQRLKGSEASSRRSVSRMGLSASSGRMADMLKTSSLDKARAIGMTRASTRISSEDEEFRRLAMAHQTGGLPG